MLEEAGIEFEHVPVDWAAGETRAPEFLEINPNGKVPLLEDGDLKLFESLAINYHLARAYASHLWPSTEPGASIATQWLAWGMGELEGPHDAANRANALIDVDQLDTSLNALRGALSDRAYILGDEFSVVDLNTACLLPAASTRAGDGAIRLRALTRARLRAPQLRCCDRRGR